MTIRTVDPLISDAAYSNGTAPMVNPVFGGQFGHQPDYNTWISNGAFVRQNIIPLVLRLPRGVYEHPRSKELIAIYKNMLEVQPRQIQGLNKTLTVETTSNPFGGAGEMQEDPVDVKREASNLSMTFQEREGRAISYALQYWIEQWIMTAESKFSNSVYEAYSTSDDRLPDYHSATMMFIEPDKTHKRVVAAWLMTNVFPKGAGAFEGGRDMASAKEAPQLNIQFAGLSQHGRGVNALAQQLLDEMTLTNASPNNRPAFMDGIEAAVKAGERGYANMIATEAATAITP